MLERLISGAKGAVAAIATVGVLATGCYIDPVTTHYHSKGWRSDAEPGPEKVVRIVPGVYNDDHYMTCHSDSRGHRVCMCKTGRTDRYGRAEREPCESIEQTQKESSRRHVLCYKKNPRDCHQH